MSLPSGGGGGGSFSSMTLRHYWHVLLERRWLVILVLMMAIAGSVGYVVKAPRIFQAGARLQIDPETETQVNLREGYGGISRIDQDYLQTQYKNLLSRSLLERVVKAERLDQDSRYSREMDVVQALAEDITIAPIRMTRLVEVKVDHTDPRKAKEITDRLANEFIEQNKIRKTGRMMSTLQVLRAQANQMERDVTELEDAVQAYRERNNFVSLDANMNPVAQSLSQVQMRYADAKAAAEIGQSQITELEAHTAAGKPAETFPSIAHDAQVIAIQTKMSDLRTDLAGYLKRYGENHPNIVVVRSRLAEAQKELNQRIQETTDTLRKSAELQQVQLANLKESLDYWESEYQKWNKAKTQYDVLQRKADASRALFNMVLSRLNEAEVMQRDTAQNIYVVDPAAIPVEFVWPNIPLVLVGGILAGLLVGVGLALFVNYLDDSIKSQDDVELHLQMPFLGYVPSVKSAKEVERYLQCHLHPQSNASESVRSIRAAVALGDHGEKLRVLTVTSTVPSEGKSVIAANLAIAMAQTGFRTLLVDADMRRPRLHKAFQMHTPVGLPTYLHGKTDQMDEVVSATEVPNLDLVCSNGGASQSTELVASRRMVQFLDEARKRYDRVILDTPPVSAVSDPLVVSSLADGCVFVSKFNKVRREHARKSLQRLQDAGVHICGVLLNDIDFEGRDSYYYSYYFYQNRYYSSYRARPDQIGAVKSA
ncbi:MAG: polysaccharide biosynthesis tyrosine autokinase [Verrucomicrobiales bacterium]|nr:polysaccharide biosynthesis tyrosine autokinase [Verrucomicrobiales bacterium]